jgi:hypothetical protein
LTAEDLRDLDITLVGDRRRLLDAIAALREGARPEVQRGPPLAAGTSAAAHAVSGGAERRQLTVMSCDLVGSTALSARLDPEDLRAVIGAHQRSVAAVIERVGGFVAKYMGDGVLAYFGYPRADEHEAERAGRAGLALVEAVAEARRLSHPHTLASALLWGWGVGSGVGSTPVSLLRYADELLALSTERGFEFYRAWGAVMRGWCLVSLGQTDEGIPLVITGLADWRELRMMTWGPVILTVAADACRVSGGVATRARPSRRGAALRGGNGGAME